MKGFVRRIYRVVVPRLFGRGFARFYLARVVFSFLQRTLRHEVVTIEGFQLYLDDTDSMYMSIRDTYEPLETNLMKLHIKPGDIGIDIGAHIGYYSLLMAKLVGSSGKVYAFEPEPSNFALLERNVRANGMANVYPVQKAVSNRSGNGLLAPSDNSMTHTIAIRGGQIASMPVETVALDEFFPDERQRVDVIKIDIEGAELLALSGMERLIRSNVCKLFIEFVPSYIRQTGHDPSALIAKLLGFGFALYQIDEQRNRVLPVDTSALCSPAQVESTNLFCVKESQGAVARGAVETVHIQPSDEEIDGLENVIRARTACGETGRSPLIW